MNGGGNGAEGGEEGVVERSFSMTRAVDGLGWRGACSLESKCTGFVGLDVFGVGCVYGGHGLAVFDLGEFPGLAAERVACGEQLVDLAVGGAVVLLGDDAVAFGGGAMVEATAGAWAGGGRSGRGLVVGA